MAVLSTFADKDKLTDITLDKILEESKETIQWSDLMMSSECEKEFRKYLRPGILGYIYTLPDTVTSYEDFNTRPGFTKLRMNVHSFIGVWIQDAKNHSEDELHDTTLRRVKKLWEKVTEAVCPGFPPFC